MSNVLPFNPMAATDEEIEAFERRPEAEKEAALRLHATGCRITPGCVSWVGHAGKCRLPHAERPARTPGNVALAESWQRVAIALDLFDRDPSDAALRAVVDARVAHEVALSGAVLERLKRARKEME